MKVYLSPSDQWSNIVAGGEHSEAFHCIKIAEYARAYLELNGYEVKIGSSVKENTYKDRVKESNEWGQIYIFLFTQTLVEVMALWCCVILQE